MFIKIFLNDSITSSVLSFVIHSFTSPNRIFFLLIALTQYCTFFSQFFPLNLQFTPFMGAKHASTHNRSVDILTYLFIILPTSLFFCLYSASLYKINYLQFRSIVSFPFLFVPHTHNVSVF